MEAKYYTPQISDIFIGFECELFYQDDFKLARTENLKWHKTIIDKNKFQQAFSLIKVNKIRVKHLDREDLLELGWEQKDYDTYEINGFGFELNPEYRNYIYETTHARFVRFSGAIKNKSELQKLMIQLNIK